jgi:glycosyltransferase involved in cell wall biosynthesis
MLDARTRTHDDDRHRSPDGSRRLRVAMVAPSLGILGGQAVQAQRLLAGWKDDPDIEAWLVPINPVPPGPFRHLLGVKYVRTAATQAAYWPLLLRELRRADVVHVFSASYFSFLLAPLPALAVARLLGRPVVLNYRSGEAPDHLRRSAVARIALRSCERNVVPSSFLADVFGRHGISARIIPNTVDLERFAFRPRQPLKPNVLSTRNLEPMYNVACTLEAFRVVQDRYQDATLTLVGGGSEEARLKAITERLRLRGVRFVGRVAPERMADFYAAADIYVQTPDIDNMPSSVLEAYASGTPVVATAVGGVPAILTDGVHGLLTPAGSPQAVAAGVIRLLEDPALVDRLTQTARAFCEHLRWPVVRKQWLALYRELAGAPAAVPAAAEVRPA